MSSIRFERVSPLQYFTQLVRSDAGFPLLEAASCVAQHADPGRDAQAVLHQMDEWQSRLLARLGREASVAERITRLNALFYTELGFAGNANNYFDPDNSDLARVVESRRGIPISLAVLWLELASGAGLQAHGVGFPGHFLVRVDLDEGWVVQDPLNGRALSREDLYERLEPFHGARATAWPLSLFLQSATPREIVARMLRNLKDIYRAGREWELLVAVQDRAIALQPEAWVEWRDRGDAHAHAGATRQALRDLETYLAHAPDEAGDLEVVSLTIARLRHQL